MTTSPQDKRLSYALVLGSLAALGPLCIDLYLPALPEMARELQTSTATSQLSLTAGLLGLGFGQIIFGPMSDSLGRMRPLLFSLVILFLASLGCAFAQNIDQLIVARLIQGLAGAGGAVISRAIARDMYSGHALTKFFALLMLVNGLAPIVAPVLGGGLLSVVSWRGIFTTLAIIAILLLLFSASKLRETLPVERRLQGGARTMATSLWALLHHRQFMGLCLTQGFIMAGMFAYIGASPFVLQQIYHLSAQEFSFCFAMNGIGLVIAAQISSRLSALWGEMTMVKIGLSIAAIACVILVIVSTLQAPFFTVLISLFFTVFAIGIISPNSASLAMQSQGKSAGSASALLGVSMFALGAISVPITGIGGTSALSMGLTIMGCYALAIIMFTTLVRTPKAAQ